MRFVIALATLALTACNAETPPEPVADAPATLFFGGTVYTGVEAERPANGVLVDGDGRIETVYFDPPPEEVFQRANLGRIDLAGATLFPGFVDAHAHLLGIGERELYFDLTGTASVAELVSKVEAEVAKAAPGEVIYGDGWIETGWPEGRMPVARDLDAVSPDNPVILERADGHAMVVNTAALDAAGIDFDTLDPSGGMIERTDDGRATGILVDYAMSLVRPLIAEPTEQDLIAGYSMASDVYTARGWTGLHNMSVNPDHAPLLERLSLEDRLELRLHNAFDAAGFDIAIERRHETPRITNRAVKLYMDGALGSRGAQLTAPYADRPDTSGLSLTDDEKLAEHMRRASEQNVQLAIHAIGDLANKRILDAFEAQFGGSAAGVRWRIEHTQILRPQDIERVAGLGLIASMQPSHAIGDLYFAPARIGIDRLRGGYAWDSLIDAGAIIAGGSDAPVEVGSPTIEFYAAVARKGLDGFQDEGWYPEEAVSRENALKMFTYWPAYAAFMEDDLGTIEAGKLADFTVFDRDLMTIPEADILDANPVMTVVGGEIVWRAE